MHVVHGKKLSRVAENFIDVGAFHGDSWLVLQNLSTHPALSLEGEGE